MPVSGSPHREQNRVSSATCNCPHFGQCISLERFVFFEKFGRAFDDARRPLKIACIRRSPSALGRHVARCRLNLLGRKFVHRNSGVEVRSSCCVDVRSGQLKSACRFFEKRYRYDEEHHRRKNSENRRDGRTLVLVSYAEKCRQHHHKENEPENAENNAVLPREPGRLALIKFGELGEETAVCQQFGHESELEPATRAKFCVVRDLLLTATGTMHWQTPQKAFIGLKSKRILTRKSSQRNEMNHWTSLITIEQT